MATVSQPVCQANWVVTSSKVACTLELELSLFSLQIISAWQASRDRSSSIVAAPTIDSSAAAVRFRLLVTTFCSSHSTALPNCYGRLTGFLNWVFRHPGPQKDPRTIVTAATVPCPVKQGGYYSIDYKEPIKFLGPVLKPLTNLWGMSPQIFSLAVGL